MQTCDSQTILRGGRTLAHKAVRLHLYEGPEPAKRTWSEKKIRTVIASMGKAIKQLYRDRGLDLNFIHFAVCTSYLFSLIVHFLLYFFHYTFYLL